jgi:2-methylcitrate dehydratase
MDKIKVVPNQEFESLFPKFQPSQVTITLKDGKSHTQRVDVPKGDPRDPMTEDEIAVKFNALGEDVVGRKACKALRKTIMGMEQQKRLDAFFQLMTAD